MVLLCCSHLTPLLKHQPLSLSASDSLASQREGDWAGCALFNRAAPLPKHKTFSRSGASSLRALASHKADRCALPECPQRLSWPAPTSASDICVVGLATSSCDCLPLLALEHLAGEFEVVHKIAAAVVTYLEQTKFKKSPKFMDLNRIVSD